MLEDVDSREVIDGRSLVGMGIGRVPREGMRVGGPRIDMEVGGGPWVGMG